MNATLTSTRPLRILVVDPRADAYESSRRESDGCEFEFCTSGRAALRHADEPLDYVVLNTSLADIAFQDVAEMFQSTAPSVGLIVVSDETTAEEEAIARQFGAILYRQSSSGLGWLAQLRPRQRVARDTAPSWTLDWQQRPSRRASREHAAAMSE